MARMTDDELSAIVDREFTTAMGAQGSEISRERAENWNYYLSKPFGNEIDGMSQIVTSDVSDVVDGMMPPLLSIFTTADNLAVFNPVGEEDIEQSEQESDYVNYVFFKRNDAFMLLYTWFFDALVQKNGIVKAWWDESEDVTRESYQGLTAEELAELMDDPDLEPIEQEERTEEFTHELPNPVTGEMVPVEAQRTLHDVVFERRNKGGKVTVMNVPPEEYRISSDSRTLNPSEARFVGHVRDVTRSELIDMGFDKDIVETLPSTSGMVSTEEEIARRDRTDEWESNRSTDKSQDLIELQEAYVKVDYDGDGRSELRQVFRGGDVLLEHDEVDRQPFHVISPKPLPHKHFGRAKAEDVKDLQKTTSTLVRETHDNLYHTNNPSHAVWEQAMTENTLDDLLVTRAGSINRFGRPVNESWAPMTLPFTAKESFAMIEYWDRVKRERTGIRPEGEGLTPDSLKHIQSSVLSQASEMSQQKIEAVVRIFAETGIKSLFLHIHELVLKHQRKKDVVELTNGFVEVNPQEWHSRKNMTVQIGLGVGTKLQNLIHLSDLFEKQTRAVELGATDMVTPRNIFNTGLEIAKNANLKVPEKFWTDPGEGQFGNNPQLQQARQIIQQLQQQLESKEAEIRVMEQDIDREKNHMQHAREMEKLQIQRDKVDNELFTKLEEVANQITELELKYSTDVPGARV
jgi:hypothetical protein